jgi:hypothetical protein
MCQAMLDNGSFDPELCPLLKGLSSAEKAKRMESPPVASCKARMARLSEGEAEARAAIRCPAIDPGQEDG